MKAPKRVQAGVDLLKDFELTPVEGNPNAFTFTMKRANAEFNVSYRKLLTHTDITIEDIAAVTYTGQALTPAATVKDGTTTLTLDTDYSVSYADNENAGTGKATIVGIGLYSGQVVKNFTINKADITPTAPTALENLTYNTQAQTLISAGTAEGGEMQYSLDGTTYAKELPQGTNAGSYTVFYNIHQRAYLQGCADQRAAAADQPGVQPAGAVARDYQREGWRTDCSHHSLHHQRQQGHDSR